MFNKLAAFLLILIIFLIFSDSVFAQPFAYVANLDSSSVSVIDTATNTVVEPIRAGNGPLGLAITSTEGPGGGGSGSCAIAGSPVQLGTAWANVLIPLVPVALVFGVRASRRRKVTA